MTALSLRVTHLYPRLMNIYGDRGNVMCLRRRCEARGISFENHGGRTRLGVRVRPLGRVRRGFGNNGEDHTEGAIYKNAIGTYVHGSLLPKNPSLADHIIRLALQRRYAGIELSPIDDAAELRAHAAALRLK